MALQRVTFRTSAERRPDRMFFPSAHDDAPGDSGPSSPHTLALKSISEAQTWRQHILM